MSSITPSQDAVASETLVEQNPGPSDESPNSKLTKKKIPWYQIDGPYAWVQVFAAGLVFFIMAGMNRSFSLIYERLLIKYGRSDSVTAWVPSVHGTVKMCSSPLIGFGIRRYTERKVCFLGSILAASSLVLTALAPSIEFVYLFYGLFYGIGANCCIISSMTMVVKYFDKKRGRAMGAAFSFVAIGSLVLGPLIQFLFKEYDYFGAMLLLSSVSFHTSISAMLMRPLPTQKLKRSKEAEEPCNDNNEDVEVRVISNESYEEETSSVKPRKRADTHGSVIHVALEGSVLDLRTDDDDKLPSCRLPKNMSDADFDTSKQMNNDPEKKSKRANKRCLKVIKSALKNFGFDLVQNHAFVMFCGFMACFVMCLDTSMSFQTSLIREKGFSDIEVTVALIFFSCFDVPCRLLSGCLFDHRAVRSHKMIVSVVLFFGMALFQLLFPLALDIKFSLAMVCLALTSCCRSVVHSQHPTVIAELVGRGRVEAGISLNRFFQGIGLLISSPLGGWLKDITGTYATGYILISSLLLLNTGTFFFIKIVSLARGQCK